MSAHHDSLSKNLAHTATLTGSYPKGHSRGNAIRRKCIDCMGGYVGEIADCSITDCALWPFRMGRDPFRKPRANSGENSE